MSDLSSKLAPHWMSFLRDIDLQLPAPVQIVCIGGFVMTEVHGFSRSTADLDHIQSTGDTISMLHHIAGQGSPLHRKHHLYVEHVGIVTMPYEYESRLRPLALRLRKLEMFIPDAYDLALSKLERNSPKDHADVEFLARKYRLSYATLHERFDREMDFLARREYHAITLEKFWREWFQE